MANPNGPPLPTRPVPPESETGTQAAAVANPNEPPLPTRSVPPESETGTQAAAVAGNDAASKDKENSTPSSSRTVTQDQATAPQEAACDQDSGEAAHTSAQQAATHDDPPRTASEEAMNAVRIADPNWPKFFGYEETINAVRATVNDYFACQLQAVLRDYVLAKPANGSYGYVPGLIQSTRYLDWMLSMIPREQENTDGHAEILIVFADIATLLLTLWNTAYDTMSAVESSGETAQVERDLIHSIANAFGETLAPKVHRSLEFANEILSYAYSITFSQGHLVRLGLASTKLGDFFLMQKLYPKAVGQYRHAYGLVRERDREAIASKLDHALRMDKGGRGC